MLKPNHLAFLLVASLSLAALAKEPAYEDGKYPPPKPPESKWIDLLAGKLEDHWSDMNCTMAGTFKLGVDDKGVAVLSCGGRPIGLIRSLRPYENFILEVDWRHLTEAPSAAGGKGTTGNSGLYVWADPLPPLGNCFTRGVEVQVCNLGNGNWYTSHGDVFPIHGATMIPDPRFGVAGSRSMPIEFRGSKTGEWNRCRITCVDGTIQQEINGALVTAGFRSSPRKGYLCIESEGGPVEFKNMRLTELPGDPGLKPEQISMTLPDGTRTTCLFDGLSLDGWTASEGQKTEWTVEDRFLRCAGKAKGELSRQLPAGDFALQIDWSKGKNDRQEFAPVALDGLGLPAGIPGDAIRPEGWNRVEIRVGAGKVSVTVNGKAAVAEQPLPEQAAAPRVLRLLNPGHPVRFCNVLSTEVPAKQP